MSVINNVLKDLQAKPSSFTPLDLAVPTQNKSSQYRPSQNKLHQNKPWMIWTAVLILVSVLLLLAWNQSAFWRGLQAPSESLGGSESSAPSVIAQGANSSPSPDKLSESTLLDASNSAELSVPEKNQLIGLQIDEQADSMAFALQFSQPAQSYLSKQSTNRYAFQLREVELGIKPPELANNEWIKQLTFEANAEGTLVRFDTRDNVLVDTQKTGQSKAFDWVITLRKKLPEPKLSEHWTKEQPNKSDAVPITKPLVKAPSTQSATTTDKLVESGLEQPAINHASGLIKLDIRPSGNDMSDAQKLQRALNVSKAGDYQQSQALLHELIGGEQDRPARLHLLALLQAMRQHAELDQQIAQALTRYPNDLDFLRLRASRLFETSRFSQLVNEFVAVRGDAQLSAVLAAAYQRLGQHQNAIESFKKSLALNPDQPRQWVSLAISQQQQQQPAQALQSYELALRRGLQDENLVNFVQRRIAMLSRQ